MKGCNCGKNCKSEFPCYTLSGTFDSNITEGTPGDMELFNSYWSHVQGVVFIERDYYQATQYPI